MSLDDLLNGVPEFGRDAMTAYYLLKAHDWDHLASVALTDQARRVAETAAAFVTAMEEGGTR